MKWSYHPKWSLPTKQILILNTDTSMYSWKFRVGVQVCINMLPRVQMVIILLMLRTCPLWMLCATNKLTCISELSSSLQPSQFLYKLSICLPDLEAENNIIHQQSEHSTTNHNGSFYEVKTKQNYPVKQSKHNISWHGFQGLAQGPWWGPAEKPLVGVHVGSNLVSFGV